MDLSSDPLNPFLASSPPHIDSMDTDKTPNEASSQAESLPTCSEVLNHEIRPIELAFSSDPLNTDPFSPAGISASIHRPLNRKRAPPSSSTDLPLFNKEPRTTATQPDSARNAILQARDLIVQAYSLTKSRDEQSKLLDLLEVFREFTEKGRIQNASSIIASQISNLETATRQIESKTRALTSTKSPELAKTPSTVSFASVASQGAKPSDTIAQEWTIVGKQKAPASTPKVAEKPTRPSKDKSNRLILIKSSTGTSPNFSPLTTRNALNKAFADKGIKGPVVLSVTRSILQNLVITTASPFTAEFLLDKQAIWQHLIAFKSAQKDEPWHKVVLHGIPIADFNTPEGMELVKEEIKTFNKGFIPIGTPYWMTSAERRRDPNQKGGSVTVAFATEAEANRAIQNRLYIAGISVRVDKLQSTAPTTQCAKCQGFGHLDSHCRRLAKCRLCGENHFTVQHYCSICKIKGSKCPHLEPKCCNCQEAHPANTRTCEVLLAIKNKAINTTH